MVDANQRSQAFRAELVIEKRATGAFVNILFGRHGYDEQIPQGPGLFEMVDVSGVQKIERPMALDKPFALRPELVEHSGGGLERENFSE
jgi:hypothetical protein